MAQRLTDAIVKRLPVPVRGNRIHYDSDVGGFGARVTAAGARAYVLTYRIRAGRQRRFTIGRQPSGSALLPVTRPSASSSASTRAAIRLANSRTSAAQPTVHDLCDRVRSRASAAQAGIDAIRLPAPGPALHPPRAGAHEGGCGRVVRYRRHAPPDHQGGPSVPGQPGDRDGEQDVLARDPLAHAAGQSGQGDRAKSGTQAQALSERRRTGAAHRGAGGPRRPRGGRYRSPAAADRLPPWRSHGRAVGRPRPDGRDLDQAGKLHQAAHRSRLAAVGAGAAAAGRDTRADGFRMGVPGPDAPRATGSRSRRIGWRSARPPGSAACAFTTCGIRSRASWRAGEPRCR